MDLSRYGLTQVESKVYLALLEHGSQQAGAITKFSGIHRRTVYDALSRLIEKGLVSYIKSGKVKRYEATHPERLMELVREQEEHLRSDLPHLEHLYELQPTRHETVFFRGKKGLRSLFDDQLQAQGILMLGTPQFIPQVERTRVRKKIPLRILSHKPLRVAHAQVRALQQPQEVLTCIYDDTVSIITFGEKPFGILIREQAIAEQYRAYFELLWKLARPA